MAVDLETIFGDIRDRLLDIAQLGVTARFAKDFADDPVGNFPAWEVTIPAATPTTDGSIIIEPQVILLCGLFTESYDGDLQRKIFYDWLPNALLKFVTYRGLTYPGNTTGVLWMLGDAELGRAEVGQYYGYLAITFPMTITLQTRIDKAC